MGNQLGCVSLAGTTIRIQLLLLLLFVMLLLIGRQRFFL